jgi:prepilin-type processing-associated H-X9-DG protein
VHVGGLNLAFADGTVRFIAISIDVSTYRFLATRAGGETLSSNAYDAEKGVGTGPNTFFQPSHITASIRRRERVNYCQAINTREIRNGV